MPNRRIREEMILAGVIITELAEKLAVTDDTMVSCLNREMGIMQKFSIMSAISEIAILKRSA